MDSHNHQQHHHNGHGHDHSHDFDPGVLYEQQWVKDQIRKLQTYLSTNSEWVGIEATKEQRLLDYACGHGTVSLALAPLAPKATFQGIDSHPKQVARLNENAKEGGYGDRMWAVQGDLSESSAELEKLKWFDFDVAVMSMALHHVPDPKDMLVQLRKRLRRGGVLVLVEFVGAGGHAKGKREEMVEVIGGQKIWTGLDGVRIKELLVAAGFTKESVDVRVPGLTFNIPDEYPNGGQKEFLFARAVAP